MSDIDRLQEGIRRASARGDSEAVRRLGVELRRLQNLEASEQAGQQFEQEAFAGDRRQLRGERRKMAPIEAIARGGTVELSQLGGLAADVALLVPRLAARAAGAVTGIEPQGALGAPLFSTGERLQEITAPIGYEHISEIPPELRPIAAVGESLAGGLGLLPVSRGLQWARLAAQATERAALPLGAELASIFGGATGAGLAQEIAPGSPGTRAAAEITGAVASPGAFVSRTLGGATEGVTSNLGGAWQAVRQPQKLKERIAASVIGSQVREHGENLDDVIRALRGSIEEGRARFTSDIEASSDALVALRNSIASKDPAAARRFGAMNEAEFSRAAEEAALLAKSPDPGAAQRAASIYRDMFTGLFQQKADEAVRASQEAAARLGRDPARQMLEASRALSRVEQEAFEAARNFERAVWKEVPKDIALPADAARRALRQLQDEVLPTQRPIPAEFQNFIADTIERGATSGNLITLRSEMLNEARKFSAAGDMANARRARIVADSVLDDLSQVPNSEVARAVSRELHDTFTRTFAGDVLATERTGAARIDEGVAASRALAGGGDGAQRLVRAEELREAAGFDPRASGLPLPEGLPETAAGAAARGARAQGALEEAATADLARNIDPVTGRPMTGPMARDLRDMQSLGVPQARELGERALAAEIYAARTEASAARRIRRVNDPSATALGRAIGRDGESTADIIGGALKRSDYDEEFGRLVKAVTSRKLPAELANSARADLVAGTIENAIRSATRGGELSFSALRREMLGSRKMDKPAVLDLLQQHGLMDREHAQRFRAFLGRMADAEKRAGASAARGGEVTGLMAAADLPAAVAGSAVGGAAARAAGDPQSLIARSAGSRLARYLLRKTGILDIQNILAHAMENKEFMLALAENPAARAAGRLTVPELKKYQRISAGMLQAGLITEREAYDAEELMLRDLEEEAARRIRR